MRYGWTLAYWLLSYWSFDDNLSSLDINANINKSTVKSNSLISWFTFLTGGVTWNAIYLSWSNTNSGGYILSWWLSMGDVKNGYSVSYFFNTEKAWSTFFPRNSFFFNNETLYSWNNQWYNESKNTIILPWDQAYWVWVERFTKGAYYAQIDSNTIKIWNKEINLGDYYFYTQTYDNNSVKVYINGVLVYSDTNKNSAIILDNYNYYTWSTLDDLLAKYKNSYISYFPTTCWLGRIHYYKQGYDCQVSMNVNDIWINLSMWATTRWYIDELKIYNRALTESEIRQQARIAGF